jgi:hypothetical protein
MDALKHNTAMHFTPSVEFSMDKKPLNELLALLSQCGEVVSKFFKPDPLIQGVDDTHRLAEFLAHFRNLAALTPIGHVEHKFGPFSVLNRFEFEGSLVSIALEGGCHRATTGLTVSDARKLVSEALDAAFPAPFSSLRVYRFDSLDWCDLTKQSTISSAYVAYQGARNLWWLLCVSDFD